MVLRYLDRPHRPGEVAPRTHPVPELVEVVPLVCSEPVDADGVHARRSAVAWTFCHASKTRRFRNVKRLHRLFRSLHQLLPRRVDLKLTWPARPLCSSPITGPSSLLRAVPPLCLAVLCPSRCPPLGVSLSQPGGRPHPFRLAVGIETTGSPLPCQRLRRAHATYTPGTARATAGSSLAEGTPNGARLCPEDQLHIPGFDAI